MVDVVSLTICTAKKNSSMDFEAKSPEIVPDPLVNIQKAIENGH